MFSPSRQRKLALLRRSLGQRDFSAAARIILPSPAQPTVPLSPSDAFAPPGPLPLQAACPGAESSILTPTGPQPYYCIRRPLDDVSPTDAGISAQFAAVLNGARQRFDELGASPELCHVSNASPGELLFMDIETCGLGAATIFLLGMMSYADGRLVFEQCLARDYSEEVAICQVFADRLAATSVLVTFNGKSFDRTMLRDRSAFHGVAAPDREPPHMDLLHEARRRWKRPAVPNCRLQTLERYLCNRCRVGDIPGAAIPDAYHRFVDTGDARQLADILHHNLLDLLTMAQLVVALLTGFEPAPSA